MSERQMLERKKDLIQEPKNGEEGALFTKQLVNPKLVWGCRYGVRILKERIG